MKTRLCILAVTALLATGCGTGSSTDHSGGNNPPAGNNPGNDNPGNDNPGTHPVTLEKKGWYLRTVATAKLPDGRTFKHNTAGVFGELDESKAGKDRHDISSYGKAILQVRFVNGRIADSGEFYSDYRHYDGQNKKEVWTFLVKNEYSVDLSHAALKIDVEKMRDVFKKRGGSPYIEKIATQNSDKRSQLVLVDVDNQQTYSYNDLETANLTMDGKHTRTFRWVLGSVDVSDMQLLDSDIETMGAENEFIAPSSTDVSKFGTPPE